MSSQRPPVAALTSSLLLPQFSKAVMVAGQKRSLSSPPPPVQSSRLLPGPLRASPTSRGVGGAPGNRPGRLPLPTRSSGELVEEASRTGRTCSPLPEAQTNLPVVITGQRSGPARVSGRGGQAGGHQPCH